MKQRIRLNENQFNNLVEKIVKELVKGVLNEDKTTRHLMDKTGYGIGSKIRYGISNAVGGRYAERMNNRQAIVDNLRYKELMEMVNNGQSYKTYKTAQSLLQSNEISKDCYNRFMTAYKKNVGLNRVTESVVKKVLKEQQENNGQEFNSGKYRYWSGQYYLWGDNMNEKVNVNGYIDKSRENVSKCQVYNLVITIGNNKPINFKSAIVDFTTLFNGKGFLEIRDIYSDRTIRLMQSPMN